MQVTTPSALSWEKELTLCRGANTKLAGVVPCPSSPHCVPPSHTSMLSPLHARRPLCKPLQLINPQKTNRETDQKMGAGTGRGAHSLGHEQTVRTHSAAVNPQPQPNQFPLPWGCSHQGWCESPRASRPSHCMLSSNIPAPATSCLSPGDVRRFPSCFPTWQASYSSKLACGMLRQCPVNRLRSPAFSFPRCTP